MKIGCAFQMSIQSGFSVRTDGTGIKSQNEKCSEFVIILRKQIAVCSPLKINVK